MLLWPDADVQYYTGLARQAVGDEAGATASFENVLRARSWGGASETAYYQALALRALGREAEAEARLHEMLESARAALEEQAKQSFATSIPEFVFAEADMETRRHTHLTYVIGLAHLGLGETGRAREVFEAVLAQEPDHADALGRLRELK